MIGMIYCKVCQVRDNIFQSNTKPPCFVCFPTALFCSPCRSPCPPLLSLGQAGGVTAAEAAWGAHPFCSFGGLFGDLWLLPSDSGGRDSPDGAGKSVYIYPHAHAKSCNVRKRKLNEKEKENTRYGMLPGMACCTSI